LRIGDIFIAGRKKRERVVAEISLAYLTQFALEIGRARSWDEAIVFLNQEGRAYEMWKRGMTAGEDYIKSELRSPLDFC